MLVGNLDRPLASKLCSHSVKPTTGARPGTVGAKLARDGIAAVALKNRVACIAAKASAYRKQRRSRRTRQQQIRRAV
ncbi:hypothetical protein ACVW0A_005036 [Pseudomonas sp. TE3610]